MSKPHTQNPNYNGGPGKVFGVNYGNTFIPEDWMNDPDRDIFRSVPAGSPEAGTSEARVCLADLPSPDVFVDRMLAHLGRTVSSAHFETMAAMGVNVVRVPCGYWNWVDFPGDTTPNAAQDDATRMAVLQSVAPAEYRPWFDLIFEAARANGIRVLLDLHGLPGSQNGEMHSGVCTRRPAFDTDWNQDKAVEAVANMASYAKQWGPTLYGIQVLNEYDKRWSSFWQTRRGRSFLEGYYARAIDAARSAGLPPETPVVLFSWVQHFDRWRDRHFPTDRFGNVVWDTHVYVTWVKKPTRDRIYNAYWKELTAIERFHQRQRDGDQGGVVVGEWSLAGPSWSAEENQALARWLVWCFGERCRGSLFWNFHGPSIAEWNFQGAAERFGVDWAGMPKP